MKQSKFTAFIGGLLVLLITLPPARAQDSENCTLIGRWPNGLCHTTFVVGNYAYIGNGGAMDIMNISDPNTPVRVGQVVTPSVVHGIFVVGNYAYIADGAAGLRIIDVSTPASPVEVGFFDTEDYARGVYVKNNYAYLADQYKGLRIINISSPTSPTEVAFLETGGTAREVFVQGNYAYLADYFNLYIIDISTPSSPTEVGSLRLGTAFGVYVQGNFAYVANWYDGLSIVDISTPASPTEVGSFDTGGYALSVYVRNNYAYVADGTRGLRIINVSTPSSPTEVGHFDDSGNARAVFVQEDYAYVANYDEGLLILDVSTPSSPDEVESVEAGGIARAVYVSDNYAYLVSETTGMNIIDISTPTSPTEVSFLKTGDYANDIHVVGNYAYVVDYYLGLRIIDVSSPFSPTEVGSLDIGDRGYNVYVLDNYAYVVDGGSGLHIIDVNTPSSPIEVGSFDTENSVYDVYVQDNYAYVANGIDGLRILDVSTPSSPVEVGISNADGASSVYVKDNYAYVTDYFTDLRIFDVSTPSSPTEVGYFNMEGETEGEATNVCVINNFAYLTVAHSGVRIIDFSKPYSPVEVGFYDTGALAVGVYANNDYVYVADGEDGLYILHNELPITIHVPDDYPTVTEAMAAADYGVRILVAPGTYAESFEMTAGVELVSETGPEETIIAYNGVPELIRGAQDAVINGFTIANNDNGEGYPGNGIYSDGDNMTIYNCIIRNNRIGIYLDNNSQAIAYNNTIDNNSFAGIYMQIEPSPEIYNNIITSNEENGIFRNTGHSLGDPFVQYNCYYGNGTDYGYYGNPWTPDPGVGEIYEDPLFVGGSPFDYNLMPNSPCIDTGDPTSPPDPDGTRADMGALYYNQTTFEVDYDWPMINGNKERNSWAKDEHDLYPPFGYSYGYPVTGKTATNISFFDQTLYIGAEGSPNTVYAYDFESATQLWNFDIPGTWGAIGCTPAVNDSLIFCGGQDGLGLYALDRLTGAQKWLTEIGSLFLRNPVVDDDLIYLVKDTMRCIYVEDGSKRWSFYLPNSKGTPTVDQEFIYFVGHNHLMKIYKRTGAIRSSIANKGYTIVVDDLSYYTCSTDSIISRDKATGARNWYYKISGVEAAGTGNIIAINDNYLCVSVWATGELYTLDKITGNYLWHYTFSDVGVYTPTIANGVVYVVNGEPHEGGPGTLWAFDLSTGNSIFNDNSEDYRGQPIIANHTLFVPAVGKVKAFRNMSVAVEHDSSLYSRMDFNLKQNYPNPFNPKTKIQFAVKKPGRVVLKVYDLLGREIAKLVNEHYQAGKYQLKFDGSGLPSGIYFYKIQIGDYQAVKKMVLLE